jgi:hypothetical protein
MTRVRGARVEEKEWGREGGREGGREEVARVDIDKEEKRGEGERGCVRCA